jgi:hypothetical protein
MVTLTDDRDDDSEDADNVLAWTRYGNQRYIVRLWLSDYIVDEASAIEQRLVMVHEALHSIHVRVDAVVWDQENMMHDYEYAKLEASYHRERELMVDSLAMAITGVPEIKRLWRETVRGGSSP